MTYNKWKQLAEEGYSSDVISLLCFLQRGEEIDETHPKTKAILSLMERKALINGGKISILGEEMLKNCEEEGEIPKKKRNISKFEEWWKTYPSTDAFVMDGRKFPGTQSKKQKKEICKKHFDRLVNEGIDADDIIKATAYHFEQAKKLSLKRGESQLTYIAGSERYLRESMFLPYIELSKEQITEPEFKSNIL